MNIPENFEISNVEYLKEVIEFAENSPFESSLTNCFSRLSEIGKNHDTKVVLFKDFSPYSFLFSIVKNEKSILHGGIIYHGKHDNGGDGNSPTFSVNLDTSFGWKIHT